jgi:hypothetical protein
LAGYFYKVFLKRRKKDKTSFFLADKGKLKLTLPLRLRACLILGWGRRNAYDPAIAVAGPQFLGISPCIICWAKQQQ